MARKKTSYRCPICNGRGQKPGPIGPSPCRTCKETGQVSDTAVVDLIAQARESVKDQEAYLVWMRAELARLEAMLDSDGQRLVELAVAKRAKPKGKKGEAKVLKLRGKP